MSGGSIRRWGVLALVAVGAAICPAGAGATTICVPSVAAACPTSGSAVGKADLEEALSFQGSDGKADSVLLAEGTYTENNAFEPGGGTSNDTFEFTGSDPLVVLGAGAGKTIITSAGSANIYVFNGSYNNTRSFTLRDLTIRIPASFPDTLGAGILLAKDDTLEDSSIVSLNDESDGVVTQGTGNVVRRTDLLGEGAEGQFGDGVGDTNEKSTVVVEDSTIHDASWGLAVAGKEASLTARRVSAIGARTYGGAVTNGTLTLENSVITVDNGIGLFGIAGTDPASLVADQVTIVNSGGASFPALEGKKFGGTAGSVTVAVRNSILRGFGSGYKTETPIGPGIGKVLLEASYSNLSMTGASLGGVASFPVGDIDADPKFLPDFDLAPGSPSIDAGDPGAGGLNTDFLGDFRPRDGNGDGVAIRDQGAYEYLPPKPREDAPDVTPPKAKITKGPGHKLAEGKAKFSFSSSEAGSSFQCKLDDRGILPCKSPRRFSHLRPGRHTFRVWATDAAGNKDPTPAKRRFRVPG